LAHAGCSVAAQQLLSAAAAAAAVVLELLTCLKFVKHGQQRTLLHVLTLCVTVTWCASSAGADAARLLTQKVEPKEPKEVIGKPRSKISS
jgi:hypothetical protein